VIALIFFAEVSGLVDRPDLRKLVVSNSILYYWLLAVFKYRRIKIMKSAEKLSITLPPEMASFIRQKVNSGLYGSNSEIIREALRGMMDRDRRLERLDTAIAQGVADAEAGRVQDIDDVRAELRGRFAVGSEGSLA
jgi:antitoxin ParD1/3/4